MLLEHHRNDQRLRPRSFQPASTSSFILHVLRSHSSRIFPSLSSVICPDKITVAGLRKGISSLLLTATSLVTHLRQRRGSDALHRLGRLRAGKKLGSFGGDR